MCYLLYVACMMLCCSSTAHLSMLSHSSAASQRALGGSSHITCAGLCPSLPVAVSSTRPVSRQSRVPMCKPAGIHHEPHRLKSSTEVMSRRATQHNVSSACDGLGSQGAFHQDGTNHSCAWPPLQGRSTAGCPAPMFVRHQPSPLLEKWTRKSAKPFLRRFSGSPAGGALARCRRQHSVGETVWLPGTSSNALDDHRARGGPHQRRRRHIEGRPSCRALRAPRIEAVHCRQQSAAGAFAQPAMLPAAVRRQLHATRLQRRCQHPLRSAQPAAWSPEWDRPVASAPAQPAGVALLLAALGPRSTMRLRWPLKERRRRSPRPEHLSLIHI